MKYDFFLPKKQIFKPVILWDYYDPDGWAFYHGGHKLKKGLVKFLSFSDNARVVFCIH